MKDIIREAVARAEAEQRPMVRPTAQALMQQHVATGGTSNFARDGDLEKVLHSLITKIKVFGCGGAGSNTIARC
ncbi:MAG TPA: cell division protein FtsZ, partial [Candidatus Thermoplasmatota archaeon]|nr:cell division protein FtsZ [Candidatus Thermoplasmatota archaeon]